MLRAQFPAAASFRSRLRSRCATQECDDLIEIRTPPVHPRMEQRISRHDRPAIRPVLRLRHQARAHRIFPNVIERLLECRVGFFPLTQHMIVRLRLEPERTQDKIQPAAKMPHRPQLIAIFTQPAPNEVHVIRHETVDRTIERKPRGGVQSEFAEAMVKARIEPASGPVTKRERPMDKLFPAIHSLAQPRQGPTPPS